MTKQLQLQLIKLSPKSKRQLPPQKNKLHINRRNSCEKQSKIGYSPMKKLTHKKRINGSILTAHNNLNNLIKTSTIAPTQQTNANFL